MPLMQKRRLRKLEPLEQRKLLTIDLAVSFEETPHHFDHGQEISYQVHVTNLGDEIAECVVVEHAPVGLSDVSWTGTSILPPKLDLLELAHPDGFGVADYADHANVHAQIVGDVNDDGIDDLLVGMKNERGPSQEAMAIIFGSPDLGVSGYLSDLRSFPGAQRGFLIENVIGGVNARAGDLNGDGIDDFFVRSASDPDEHHILFGRQDWSDANYQAITDIENRLKIVSNGHSLGPAGDFNGDGIYDILVVKGGEQENRARVIPGRQSFSESQEISLSRLEFQFFVDRPFERIEWMGDFQGDGFDDLMVVDRNGVWLASGRELTATSPTSLTTTRIHQHGAGHAVGDINGDGRDDIYSPSYMDIPAPTGDLGTITLGSPTGGTTIRAEAMPSPKYSHSGLKSIGDINSDGRDDFVSFNYDQASVVFGPSQLDDATTSETLVFPWEVTSAPATDGRASPVLFYSAFGRGDLNGDGIDDFVLGGRSSFSWRELYVLFGKSQSAGTAHVHDTLRIQPNETIRYEVTGTVDAGANPIDLTASATDCWDASEPPPGDIHMEVSPIEPQLGDDVGGHEIRLVNHGSATVTATVESDLSDQLVNPTWERRLGFPPTTNLSMLEQGSDRYWRFIDFEVAGDFDGDGRPDLAITQWLSGYYAHSIRLTGEGLEYFNVHSEFVVILDDLDGDGRSEISDLPDIFFELAANPPFQSVLSVTFGDDEGGTTFGFQIKDSLPLISTGDVNGDGVADLLVGAEIMYGTQNRAELAFLDFVGGLGWRIIDDLDGDGLDEFAKSSEDELVIQWGEREIDPQQAQRLRILGTTDLSLLGDVNGDGFNDFFAPAPSDAENNHGQIVFGSPELRSLPEIDLRAENNFGPSLLVGRPIEALRPIGDFNHDGFDDFSINSAEYAPVDYIILGRDSLTTSGQLDVNALMDGFNGFELVRPQDQANDKILPFGDQNQDGIDDFVTSIKRTNWLTDLTTVYGVRTYRSEQGDLDDQIEVAPGATAVISVTGELISPESPLAVDVVTCECRDQIDGNLENNAASVTLTVAPTIIPGDVNGDGRVSFADFLVVSANFGRQVDVTIEHGDLNADGKVGFSDAQIIAANFGRQR